MGRRWSETSARTHLVVGAVIGFVVAVAVLPLRDPLLAGLAGWAAAASSFVLGAWLAAWPLDAAATRELAVREDPSRRVAQALVVAGAIISLLVVARVLIGAQPQHGGTEAARVVVGVIAIVAAWVMVHTTYWLRYARLYYTEPVGGIDFHSDDEKAPRYSDFAYLAFTVGMTFQVSDTEITRSSLRRTVLGQAGIAFLFVAVVLAVTINIVAGLGAGH